VILLIFAGLNFTIFGQEKTPEESKIGRALLDIFSKQEETPKPTPESKKTTRERKVEESNTSSTPQNPPDYSPEYYPAPPQPKYAPTVDYLKEAERFQRQMESDTRKQNAAAQQQIEEFRRQQEDSDNQSQDWLLQQQRQQELQNQTNQQEDRPVISINKPTEQEAIEAEKRADVAKKIAAEQRKWMWLIPLFELIQVIILALVAYRKGIAKKSSIAMITGLIGCALGLGIFALYDFHLTRPGVLAVIVAMICFNVFFFSKTSSYIIILLSQKSLSNKLLSVFSIGLALIAVYMFFNSRQLADHLYILYGMASGFGVISIGGIIALVKSSESGEEDLHGSARFAEKKDFKEFENPIENGAFILAPAHPNRNHGKIALPRSLSLMHGLILGGTGTGKSRGFFMPNCAEVENTSLVVTDPKSELWKYTSGYHDKAMRYAPTEPEASQSFNWIPLCTDARMSELCARALMTAGSTGNTDQFWIDSETAFLSAIFSHAATTKYPTPLTAYRLFTRQKPEELMQQLLHSPSYVAREQAIVFEQTDARIKGAIVPAIASRLQFMRDPNIQLFTSAQLEAPNFGRLRRTPTAVYWCLREQDIARLRPLTSLFFTVLLEQIAGEEIPEGENIVPITAMLDEFANIGKIPDFETTISLARGRGVALWLGVQSLSQFKQTYGEHAAQTIMSNCATKVALHGLDYQTAEYVSKSLGEQTISHSSSSFNFGLTGGSIGSHAAKHRRPLLTPDEVMRIGENEAIARTSNKYPMKLYKGYYDAPPKTYPVTPSLTKVYVEETTVAEDLAL
jgi:type IV secretion system protein VirD4